MVTTTQELWNITRNILQVSGYYLSDDGPLIWAIATWPRNIDLFGWQYDRVFSWNCIFGANLVDSIHKRVQVFLHN